MKIYAFLLLSGALVHSCKKADTAFKADLVNVRPPDNIQYFDLAPDDSIQSVDYFYQKLVGWNYCTVPFPENDNISKEIDFENNSSPDLQLSAEHKLVQISVSGCPTFKYSSKITCLNGGEEIITQSPGFGINNPFPYPFQFGDTIKENGSSHKTACIHQFDVPQPVNSYLNPTYIGFKRTINDKTYYGWILIKTNSLVGIKVYAMAINTTPGNTIKAGQVN